MNTYKVTYVAVDATQTTSQTMAVDSVLANDYEVGADFLSFVGEGHEIVAAYAIARVVSIVTIPASSST